MLSLWYFFCHTTGLDRLAVCLKILPPTLEGAPGPIHRQEITHVPFQEQHLPGSEIVERPSPAHHVLKLLVGQTLIEHRQVIAEIQESLHRITLRQRTASHMIRLTVRQAHDATPHDSQSPAEVYLLIMGEEAGIQSSCLPIILRPNHQGSTRCPENISGRIILAIVRLHRLKDTTSTEGVT